MIEDTAKIVYETTTDRLGIISTLTIAGGNAPLVAEKFETQLRSSTTAKIQASQKPVDN